MRRPDLVVNAIRHVVNLVAMGEAQIARPAES